MVLEILCVEPIYPQYSGVLDTCSALRYWFFEVLGSKSVKFVQKFFYYSLCTNDYKTYFLYKRHCRITNKMKCFLSYKISLLIEHKIVIIPSF